MKKIALILFLTITGFSQFSKADMSYATGRISNLMGSRMGFVYAQSCNMTAMSTANKNLGSYVSNVNQTLCFLKLLGANGVTGSAGKTTTYKMTDGTQSQTFSFHYVLNAPGPTIDGSAYAYELKIWMCTGTCTAASNYYPAGYVAFNTSSDLSVNNGVIIANSGSAGAITNSSFIKWDTGTATTKQYVKAFVIDCGGTSPGPEFITYSVTGTVATLTLNEYFQSSGMNRELIMWDSSTNTGNWYQDATNSVNGDTPGAWGGGFTRTTSTNDYTYTAAGSAYSAFTIPAFPSTITGANLVTYSGQTCSSMAASGNSTVLVGTGILSTVLTSAMNGMPTTPPNL